MDRSSSQTSVVVAAHVIKFGIPLGLAVIVGRLISYVVFGGNVFEVVAGSAGGFVLCLILSVVLGLYRRK